MSYSGRIFCPIKTITSSKNLIDNSRIKNNKITIDDIKILSIYQKINQDTSFSGYASACMTWSGKQYNIQNINHKQ